MPTTLHSDDEFLKIWESEGGANGAARALGVGVRAVQRRRRRIEQKMNISLESTDIRAPKADSCYGVKLESLLEIDNGSVIIFSDAHWYAGAHLTQANRALLKLSEQLQPKAIIANGDILDAPQISRHEPIGWQKTTPIRGDLEMVQKRLAEIERAAPKAKLLRTVGNHDLRFDSRLAKIASEFRDVHGFRLRDHIPRWDESWLVNINAGEAVVKHRWHGGLSATWSNTLKSGVTMVTGHLHRLTVSPHVDYRGRRWGVDTGTLADVEGPHTEYLEGNPRNWASGFAVLTFNKGKLLPPELCEVLYGKAWFRGREV